MKEGEGACSLTREGDQDQIKPSGFCSTSIRGARNQSQIREITGKGGLRGGQT